MVQLRTTLRALALSAVALASRGVAAQDRWRAPHPGVRHLHRHTGTFDYHLLRVDLAAARPRFVGTDEGFLDPRVQGAPRTWRTTSDFARHVGADVAVNANYFDIHHGRFGTCGLAMASGRAWRSSYADRRLDCDWSLGFGAHGRVELFDSREKVLGPAPFAWITEAVTGSPRVLANGEVLRYTHPRHALQRNPRTLLGVDAGRRTLFVMMVNGREGRNQGMTCPEAAAAMKNHGATDAVNLDGGGSSALYVRAEGGLVSHPADGMERGVANHLGIIFGDPAGDPAPAPEVIDPPVPQAPVRVVPAVQVARAEDLTPPAPVVLRAGCASSPTATSGLSGVLVLALSAGARRFRGARRRSRGSA
jgi:hypothetical protein